jgi:cystathionine beta-lyase/cystathionine gamma-synthase
MGRGHYTIRVVKDMRGLDLSTIAAHGVRAPAPETLPDGERSIPSAEPLSASAVYDFASIAASDRPLAQQGGYVYARYGHPNGRTLELTLAALEGSEDAVATSSGMAAVACAVLAVAQAGDRVVVQADAYGGTIALLSTDFARMGIRVEPVCAYRVDAVRDAAKGAKAVVVETISNPLVREVDLAALAAVCREAGATLFVDNTFATPIVARPLADGADCVVHSATKFIGGHHDVIGGIVCGTASLCRDVRGVAKRIGCVIAPFDAWMASRGVKTLALRVERAQETARLLSARLRGDSRVRAVAYPGRGAMLAFDVGDGAAAARFVDAVRLLTLTPSLGGTTTTLSHPATSSHRGFTPAERAALGIGDGLLRLSVGIESPADVWSDLDRALGATAQT